MEHDKLANILSNLNKKCTLRGNVLELSTNKGEKINLHLSVLLREDLDYVLEEMVMRAEEDLD